MKTKDMAYIALMAVLISVCSWLSVPAAIPFTMQTYAVFTALLLLGGRRGSIAVAVYIALGAVGLPVFSGFAKRYRDSWGRRRIYLRLYAHGALLLALRRSPRQKAVE